MEWFLSLENMVNTVETEDDVNQYEQQHLEAKTDGAVNVINILKVSGHCAMLKWATTPRPMMNRSGKHM